MVNSCLYLTTVKRGGGQSDASKNQNTQKRKDKACNHSGHRFKNGFDREEKYPDYNGFRGDSNLLILLHPKIILIDQITIY